MELLIHIHSRKHWQLNEHHKKREERTTTYQLATKTIDVAHSGRLRCLESEWMKLREGYWQLRGGVFRQPSSTPGYGSRPNKKMLNILHHLTLGLLVPPPKKIFYLILFFPQSTCHFFKKNETYPQCIYSNRVGTKPELVVYIGVYTTATKGED